MGGAGVVCGWGWRCGMWVGLEVWYVGWAGGGGGVFVLHLPPASSSLQVLGLDHKIGSFEVRLA